MQSDMRKKPKQSSKGASFIKILGHDFSNQLQLPEEFMINLNGYVPHRFIIETNMTKRCWRVEVEKEEDGRMFLRDGWSDFVEAHSLEVGNLLLFEYEEQSIFQARIYDRNGCERTILVDNKEKQHKLVKSINDDEEESEAVENEPVLVKNQQQRIRLAPKKYGRGIYKRKHAVPRSYRRTAKVFINPNSLCFSIIIHYSKKHQFASLTIPKAISVKLKLPSKNELKLQDAQGKIWTVALSHRKDGRAICTQGWKEFMKESKVAPGDKLNFDFISDELVRFYVTKPSKVEHQSKAQAIESLNVDRKHETPSTGIASNCGALETEKTTKITNCESGSSFSLYWRESSTNTYLYMPKLVARSQDLMNKERLVLRDPEGKCWPLEVKKLTGGRVVLTNGWVEFWKGYGIKTGDLLNFEFVSAYLIKVSISQGKPQFEPDFEGAVVCMDNEDAVAIEQEAVITQEEFDADIKHEAVVTGDEFGAVITQEEFKAAIKHETPSTGIASNYGALETEKTTKITNCESGSSFSLYWRESSARTYLYMPKLVARSQDLMNKKHLVLRDPEGKCWPLEVKKLTGDRVVLTNGWVEFWKGYGIKTGDLLNFEFVSAYLIKVSISQGKPQFEPDFESTVVCMDNEDAVAIEQEAVITQEEFNADIKHEAVVTGDEFGAVIAQEEFDAAIKHEAVGTGEELGAATSWGEENYIIN